VSSTTPSSDWTVIRPSGGLRALDLRELWRYRALIGVFAVRDVKVRYRQAALGIGWAALTPLAAALTSTLIFWRLLGISTGGTSYLLYAFVGYATWTYFTGAVNAGSWSMLENGDLISKVYFPRLTAPVATALPGMLDFLIALLVLIPLCIIEGQAPGPQIVLLPIGIALLLVTALGVGLIFGTLHVRFRDIGHATAFVLQLWFVATPIVYPSTLVHGNVRYLYYLNPMAGVLDWLRWCLIDWSYVGTVFMLESLAVAVAFLAIGLVLFLRDERRFADLI
jgi:ABC-type polysaccharide/polyol phosphate export permease